MSEDVADYFTDPFTGHSFPTDVELLPSRLVRSVTQSNGKTIKRIQVRFRKINCKTVFRNIKIEGELKYKLNGEWESTALNFTSPDLKKMSNSLIVTHELRELSPFYRLSPLDVSGVMIFIRLIGELENGESKLVGMVFGDLWPKSTRYGTFRPEQEIEYNENSNNLNQEEDPILEMEDPYDWPLLTKK